jgi:hypothetical protein
VPDQLINMHRIYRQNLLIIEPIRDNVDTSPLVKSDQNREDKLDQSGARSGARSAMQGFWCSLVEIRNDVLELWRRQA